jgi:hypothetical protein
VTPAIPSLTPEGFPLSRPPAAWHPDPENPNQLRWWDGHQWTNSTAPLGASSAAASKKPRTGWRIAGIVIGSLVVGGVLARWSPVAIVLVAFAVAGIALFVLVVRPVPAVGLRSRSSGLVALGMAALLVLGGGIASANTNTDAPIASNPRPLVSIPTSTPKHTPAPTPTTFDTVTEEVAIPFEQTTTDDPLLDQGATALVVAGVAGVKVLTYRVKLVDSKEVSRELVSEVVQTTPVNEVTAIGSKAPAPPPAPVPLVQQGGGGCDPNYTGACVPIASDVDCAGGGGDGPAYVQGPVQVIGRDIYKLDRDGDGIACDK